MEHVSTAVLIGMMVEMRVAFSSLRREFDNHISDPSCKLNKRRKLPAGTGAVAGVVAFSVLSLF